MFGSLGVPFPAYAIEARIVVSFYRFDLVSNLGPAW